MDSNLFWCVVGIIGGAILSAIISLIFFILSKRRRKISYIKHTYKVIMDKLPKINELEIKYKGNDVTDLSYSQVEFTNSGNETLELDDFPKSKHLSISTKGQFFINTPNELEIASSNNDITIDVIIISHQKIEINFDYLNPHDKIIFNILHTDNINVNGNIKGGRLIDNTQISENVIIEKYIIPILQTAIILMSLLFSKH